MGEGDAARQQEDEGRDGDGGINGATAVVDREGPPLHTSCQLTCSQAASSPSSCCRLVSIRSNPPVTSNVLSITRAAEDAKDGIKTKYEIMT